MSLFAFKTLLANRGKLLTALVGVVFALVLVNLQGGLFLGLVRRATVLIDHSGADLWVGHRLVENVDLPQNIPEVWLNRIRGVPGVHTAEPYIVGGGMATLRDGGYETVWVIGSEPSSMLGTASSFVEGSRDDLRRPNAVSFDALDARKLGYPRLGDVIEVNDRRARIVAKTDGILGFMTTPYLFTTLETARRLASLPDGYCSYFLIKAEPGADVAALRAAIQRQVPNLDVFTARDFGLLSRNYWLQRTGIGVSFGTSTLLGVFIGLVMVAQSLYALVLDHLTDYAALKALGAENRHIYGVVLAQALIIALLGSVVGSASVLVMQRLWASPLAPIEIPPALLAGAIGLVVVICVAAAVLPMQRIRRVDPAIVLQG